jgi:hypothetical protein
MVIQLNKKTIYIVVAVLVIIIVVAAAAILLMGNNGGTPDATPTPTPAPQSVVDAETLVFNVAETTDGITLDYAFASKNVNTTTQVVRMDLFSDTANYSYIIDVGAQTSFVSTDNGATWSESHFDDDSAYVVAFADYQVALVNWDGHSETYSFTAEDGRDIVISAIHVNAPLDDETYFTHS